MSTNPSTYNPAIAESPAGSLLWYAVHTRSRHEKKIATRFNPMRQRMIVTDAHGGLFWITMGKILKCLFQRRRTAAQQSELHGRRKHFRERAEQEIAALLVHQSADVSEQRNLGRRRQSEFPLQRQFGSFLAPKIPDVK